jgi:tRNA threonylcarbamoyladenosine biosynthesis protein TsaE
LWAWKTEFTKQLAQNLWIQNISSPTYTYINNYQNKLLHWDFYRINSEIEFINLWILDEIEDAEYICIEWPKFTHLYADSNWLKVKIQKLPSGERKIVVHLV